MNNGFTLDSFALLAWFQNEKSAEKVDHLIKRAGHKNNSLWLSVINLGEIFYIIFRERGAIQAEHALSVINGLPISIVPADKELTLKAAEIKALHSVSYADAFSAALAVSTNSIVVTGDPEFRLLSKIVRIEWLER